MNTTPKNTKMFTTEKLTLKNKSNATAEFRFLPFEAKKPLFRMEPVTAKIKSKESMDITFFYEPRGKKTSDNDLETCLMKITDGPFHEIKLEGIVPSCRVLFSPSVGVNFGVIPVACKVEKVLTLKNTAKFPTVFTIV